MKKPRIEHVMFVPASNQSQCMLVDGWYLGNIQVKNLLDYHAKKDYLATIIHFQETKTLLLTYLFVCFRQKNLLLQIFEQNYTNCRKKSFFSCYIIC